jgi:hypothetical protein
MPSAGTAVGNYSISFNIATSTLSSSTIFNGIENINYKEAISVAAYTATYPNGVYESSTGTTPVSYTSYPTNPPNGMMVAYLVEGGTAEQDILVTNNGTSAVTVFANILTNNLPAGSTVTWTASGVTVTSAGVSIVVGTPQIFRLVIVVPSTAPKGPYTCSYSITR